MIPINIYLSPKCDRNIRIKEGPTAYQTVHLYNTVDSVINSYEPLIKQYVWSKQRRFASLFVNVTVSS